MASPMPHQPNDGWIHHGQAMPPQQQCDDSGVRVRQVGLKVLYKFNREDKFDCLARPSQTYSVQTIAIDESTLIGVIDLRACIRAVVDCSPEMPDQEYDYTVYAHDYSEPDTPLVGQGSLSLALGSLQSEIAEPKMVTGLLTRNKLGLLMGKNQETLEVKMKFTETQRASRPQAQPVQAPTPQYHPPQNSQPPPEPQRHNSFSQQRSFDRSHTPTALTPTGTSEWNSFIQQNPQLGQQPNYSRGASPALSQTQQQPTHSRSNSSIQHPRPQAVQQHDLARVAPTPGGPPSETGAPGPASRPSSRASDGGPKKSKPRAPTGRPRGRPRNPNKKRSNTGNTSGYEEGTEDEGRPAPKRARATITQVDNVNNNPFGSEPDSLRVAASTSGSLRNFRPVGLASEGSAGNHLQEVPRAPTPVPTGPFRGGGANNKKRPRQSAMSHEVAQTSPQPEVTRALSPSQQDGRSPESTTGQTPAYSEDSPAEIGSSPPVPRTTSFMRSSPPPSSPMLPPMPVDQAPPMDALEQAAIADLYGNGPLRAAAASKSMPARRKHGGKPKAAHLTKSARVTTPMQVWSMEERQDGTMGLSHIRSYNQPGPHETYIAPLGPLPKGPGHYVPPSMVPTPPATTDATEKPTSPPQSDPTQSRNGLPEPGPPSFPFERRIEPPSQKDVSLPDEEQQVPPQPAPEAETSGLAYPQPYVAPLPQSVPTPQSAPTAAEQHEKSVIQAPATESQAPAEEENTAVVPPMPNVEAQMQPQAAPPATKKRAPAKPRPSRAKAPAKPRNKLARSQSAGNLAAVPASEPIGPSALSRSVAAEPELPMNPPVSLRRAQSTGPLNVPVAASDPVGPASGLEFPRLAMPQVAQLTTGSPSDAILEPSTGLEFPLLALPEPVQPSIEPASEAIPERSSPATSKNIIKRNSIKQRLEAAITRGEMPNYCCNCGAIETPTWRKIYCQEHEGPPPVMTKEDFSVKPGMITTLEILKEHTDDEPGRYRIVKKSLDRDHENPEDFQHRMLCNSCGIWLGKTNEYRPQAMWQGDAERLGKTRKRKPSEPVPAGANPKRSRSKSTAQPNLTSEANGPLTDGLAPAEGTPYQNDDTAIMREESVNTTETAPIEIVNDENDQAVEEQPGSRHSSGTGSAESPIELELNAALGSTKRLLFPSPRKDNAPKALSDLDVNIVQTGDFRLRKEDATPTATEKGTIAPPEDSTIKDGANNERDELEDLFRSPLPPRPCTPPSIVRAGPPTTPFKTPTRATPSNRPITRSVSRSLRSKGSNLDSPSAALNATPSRTPSKTLRDEYDLPGSVIRQPSPRHQVMVDIDERLFDTPMSRAMNQLLSEPNFGLEDDDIDLVPSGNTDWDSFNIFSTDAPLPSSPPKHYTGPDDSWDAPQPKEWGQFLKDIQAANVRDEERD